MDYPLFSKQGQHMTNAIETLYVQDNVPTWERQLHLYTRLANITHKLSTHIAVRIQLLN